MARRVLILGGTEEARLLAERMAKDSAFDPVLSLAGRTKTPLSQSIGIAQRIGGFGGAVGLQNFLTSEHIEAVVIATHPFAVAMTQTAYDVCQALGLPHIRLTRPAWKPVSGDDWHMVPDLDQAREALPENARVFMAIGRQQIGHFVCRHDCQFVMRSIESADDAHPGANWTCLTGWPGRSVDDEIALFKRFEIEWIVCKNSGGERSSYKLAAARKLGVKVITITRPEMTSMPEVTDIETCFTWLAKMN